MKVSYEWLSQYVDVSGYSAEELAEKLTYCGIEVGGVERRNQGVSGVVVGYVAECYEHPDADKLSVCQVDVGLAERLQIVCGAKNVAAGQKVSVALEGAELPGDFQVKRTKLRGVESIGMICSAKELGINEKLLPKELQEGILVLPDDTKVGDSILEVLGMSDEVLELDLTPNRSDCLSMIGVAYEIGAILGRPVKLPNSGQGLSEAAEPAAERLAVSISAGEQCSHYAVRLIKDVTIGASPQWLQNQLIAAGIRPINNIVDATNYVMLEYGQPLHAFDADCITDGHLDVRLATAGEAIVTLDGQERMLTADMLIIVDGSNRPVAVAGVMGSAHSEVTPETTNIILESAHFAGGSVRKTSRQLGLRSEASVRFEKEVNPEGVVSALDRAAGLICLIAGGKAAKGVVEAGLNVVEPLKISLTLEKVNGHLGMELTMVDVQVILDRLGFTYREIAEVNGVEQLEVLVPKRRGDITRDVDLIEEIVRLYGYEHIPTTRIIGVTTSGALTQGQRVRRKARSLLVGAGLQEVVSYSLIHPSKLARFGGRYREVKPIGLAMPMSEDRSVLRISLIPSLLDTAIYNRNRNVDDVAIFEIGKIYKSDDEKLTKLPEERLLLSLLWTGNRAEGSWTGKPEKVDFYDLKGVLDKMLTALGLRHKYRAATPAGFHPGRTAEIVLPLPEGSVFLGTIGQLHPTLQKEWDLEDTYVAELELDVIAHYADFATPYRGLPRYPAVTRDLAVVVETGVAAGDLMEKVKESAGEWLESVHIFDVYTGDRLGPNRKSVALSLVFRHPERTLTDDEISALHSSIVATLEQSFAAELRK